MWREVAWCIQAPCDGLSFVLAGLTIALTILRYWGRHFGDSDNDATGACVIVYVRMAWSLKSQFTFRRVQWLMRLAKKGALKKKEKSFGKVLLRTCFVNTSMACSRDSCRTNFLHRWFDVICGNSDSITPGFLKKVHRKLETDNPSLNLRNLF